MRPSWRLRQVAFRLPSNLHNSLAVLLYNGSTASLARVNILTMDSETGVFLDGYDAYRYLTVDQALEDVVYFAQHFNTSTVTAAYKDTVDPWYDTLGIHGQ